MMAKFGNATTGSAPSHVLSLRGAGGERERRDEGGRKSDQTHRQVRVMGLTTKTRCAWVEA